MRTFILLFVSLLTPHIATAGGIVTHNDSSGETWLSTVLASKMPLYAHLEQCIEYAAYSHNVLPELVLSVISVEDGAKKRINPNTNNSVDHGIMQINTIRIPEIEKYGVTPDLLVENDCLNVFMGTYLLANEISKVDDFWEGVGNYHYNRNGKYPRHHFAYIQRVYQAWNRLIN